MLIEKPDLAIDETDDLDCSGPLHQAFLCRPQKMARLRRWCADATAAEAAEGGSPGQRYDFVFVNQNGFEEHAPKTFAALVGAGSTRGGGCFLRSHRRVFSIQRWKRWNVGVKAVREFLGALTDTEIPKGIFIALPGYTRDAKLLANKHGIEIVNETRLARKLELTNARFDSETLAILQDTRKYCPKCESEMVLRTATKGLGAGKQFWGCSAYPRCRFTMPKD